MRWPALSAASFARSTLLLLTLIAAGPVLAQQNAPELRAGILVVPPFVVRQEDGSLTGYGIDLWNAVSAELKMKTDYVIFPDQYAVLDAMLAKKVEVLAAPVVITSARDAVIDFSLPIMQAGLLIAVRDTGEPTSVNPLEDLLELLFSKTMLVWLGIALVLILENTVAVDYLKSHNIKFQEFHRADPMIQALLTKQVDAIVFNAPILLYYTAHDGKGLVRIVGPEFYVSPIAFGFQLDSPLRRKVNGALLALRENGTYQKIYDKWFGVQ